MPQMRSIIPTTFSSKQFKYIMNNPESVNRNDYITRLDKDNIHITTRPYLDKVESHTEPYETDVFGVAITVLPGVMSPKYDWAGLYMIKWLPEDLSGQDVLEIGPGTGLVSVFAGLRGARSVTAADINPVAVENTNMNLEKHSIANSKAVISDVFDALKGNTYDTIIFNLPYHDGAPKNDLEKGVIDEGYAAMTKFCKEVKTMLNDGGKIYLGFSQSGNVERLKEVLEKNSIRIEAFEERNTWDDIDPAYSGPDFHYNCQAYRLSFNV